MGRNIPGDFDDGQVTELFTPFGEVVSSLILNDGKSERRYGFINFKEAESTDKAIEALHGKDMRTEEEIKVAEEAQKAKEEAEKEKKADTETTGDGGETKAE